MNEARAELRHMTNVLLGREPSPIPDTVDALLEVASAYLGRALEMQGRIQAAEANGVVAKGSKWYRFRTGELRTFIELASDAVELGSRRITVARSLHEITNGSA